MELISAEQRREYFANFKREAVHLELRDDYATSDLERERFAAWRAGEFDDLSWMAPWCERIRGAVEEGRRYRRACVVSEPLSEYRRFAYDVVGPSVAAGEEIHWVPRRLVSAIALPGNDFWMFDEEAVVFAVFSGNGEVVERQLHTDPAVIELCADAFDAVWSVSIPHGEYRPA
ncbi:hypothetical protein OIE66_02735 [Nonomuraea sp. NBC_01738]|uniref:DUF6879 family protein n=1 Tax=Nonomuraea sp. NBC_01738 TaxID=2976003 RepID=UPI002E0F53C1|nr:DUF6879 family protein [Nonomuraea sp. NBC_01738]WSG15841.1 hypothetical protein OIE66_02735 [Nonomuraea sp. NBC_01738]